MKRRTIGGTDNAAVLGAAKHRIRTRPDVVVDAFQFTKLRLAKARVRRGAGASDRPAWVEAAFGPPLAVGGLWWGRGKQQGKLVLGTADGGRAIVRPAYWVIRDPQGRLSVTDPVSFDVAYEAVDG